MTILIEKLDTRDQSYGEMGPLWFDVIAASFFFVLLCDMKAYILKKRERRETGQWHKYEQVNVKKKVVSWNSKIIKEKKKKRVRQLHLVDELVAG